jgi:Soluble lytic murein transglycosylase and related regulatory proteins (some contain LysM/invasin domains)
MAAAAAIPFETRQNSEKAPKELPRSSSDNGKPPISKQPQGQDQQAARSEIDPSPKPTATPSSQSNINRVKAIFDQQPKLIQAVIKVESAGKQNARSEKGAQGLMQLMPGTAKDMGVSDPYDPAQNVEGGKRYLGQMLTKYGDRDLALAAYNFGPGNLDRLMSRTGKKSFEAIRSYLPKETQLYVSKIRALLKRKTIELEV